jgi:hypothetical protein
MPFIARSKYQVVIVIVIVIELVIEDQKYKVKIQMLPIFLLFFYILDKCLSNHRVVINLKNLLLLQRQCLMDHRLLQYNVCRFEIIFLYRI